MKIFKTFDKKIQIENINLWFKHCPPQKGLAQWKDFRSAKEMANFWTNKEKVDGFLEFIKDIPGDYYNGFGVPEYESKFDKYHSGRKHDLLCIDADEISILTIEGKADEPFGYSEFALEFKNSIDEKEKNHSSKKLERIIGLYSEYFHGMPDILGIKYQLSFWFAGTLVEAVNRNLGNMVMIVQEFYSEPLNLTKLNKNKEDFRKFISLVTEGEINELMEGEIIGPIKNRFTGGKNLFLGKYRTELALNGS